MKRVFPVVALVVGALLAPAQPAYADFIDWLQDLSGPGHFDHKLLHSAFGTGPCFGAPTLGLLAVHTTVGLKTPCIYVDVAGYRAEREDHKNQQAGYGDVDAQTNEFGLTFGLIPSVEVGAGGGWIHFDTNGIETNRGIVTPLRVVLKPLALVPGWQRKGWAGIWKFYVRRTIIVGGLNGADFGVAPGIYDEPSEGVWSRGFAIDVGELVGCAIRNCWRAP